MNSKWNKITWYSKVISIVLGIGIFALGISIGSLYERGRTAMDIAEGLHIDRGAAVQRETKQVEPAATVTQEGNIKNMATGSVERDSWVLVYGQPGAPTVTKGLLFTTQSRCAYEKGILLLCNTALFKQEDRVRVMGTPDADGNIVIERLEMVN